MREAERILETCGERREAVAVRKAYGYHTPDLAGGHTLERAARRREREVDHIGSLRSDAARGEAGRLHDRRRLLLSDKRYERGHVVDGVRRNASEHSLDIDSVNLHWTPCSP